MCGVFRKSAPWHDSTFYVPLAAAQSLYDWPGDATNIKITLDRRVQPLRPRRARARRGRHRRLRRAGRRACARRRVRVETFDEAGRFSFSIIQANETALVVLSSFLFLAAAVGIVNAMLMSVHERTREIGTMRALGMRRAMVVRLFVLEGLALGLVSAVAGRRPGRRGSSCTTARAASP